MVEFGLSSLHCMSRLMILLFDKPAKGITWKREWASSLQSAITGGQWPQARKAQLKSFDHASYDNRCQLCFQEAGTLQY